MSDVQPAIALLRTAYKTMLTASAELPLKRKLIVESGIPKSDWTGAMHGVARLFQFVQKGADTSLSSGGRALLRGFRDFPLLPLAVDDGHVRLVGTPIELAVDAWVGLDRTSETTLDHKLVLGWLVPLSATLSAVCVAAALPAESRKAVEAVVPSGDASHFGQAVWKQYAASEGALIGVALRELARHRPVQYLSDEDRIRVMGVRYGIDLRVLLEYGYFDESGKFKQEDFPIRDIRTLLAEEDQEGLKDAVGAVRRFRGHVLGRELTDAEEAELDRIWPLDGLFDRWYADADGNLTSPFAWNWRRESVDVLQLPEDHDALRVLGEAGTVGAAQRWAERHDNEVVAKAIQHFVVESRWIGTWGGQKELVAAARDCPHTVYDQLRTAFIALFDPVVGDVLVRVGGRWSGVSQTLADAIGLAPDEMTIGRLPLSWSSLQQLNALSDDEKRDLTVEMARLASGWRR